MVNGRNNFRLRRGNLNRGRITTRQKVNRDSRLIHASRPERLAAGRQLLSIPPHSYSFKIQRVFRINFSLSTSAPTFTLTSSGLRAAINSELGIPISATGQGEAVAVHSVRIYGSSFSVSATGASYPSTTLDVSVFDIEEAETAGANIIDRYIDQASPSGVARIFYRYPVNNRPTFTRSTTAVNLLTITSPTIVGVTAAGLRGAIDVLCDYTRVNNNDLLFHENFVAVQ